MFDFFRPRLGYLNPRLPHKMVCQQIDLFLRQAFGMMMHHGRSLLTRPECSHLADEIICIKSGKHRCSANAIAVSAVAGSTGGGENLDMELPGVSRRLAIHLQWQKQQHQRNCLEGVTPCQAIKKMGYAQYRYIKGASHAFALAAVILGAGSFQDLYG